LKKSFPKKEEEDFPNFIFKILAMGKESKTTKNPKTYKQKTPIPLHFYRLFWLSA